MPQGGGEWCELHILRDDGVTPSTYRMVAWQSTTSEVVLNSNLLPTTTFTLLADDFGELVNVGESIFGLYFPDQVSIMQHARSMHTARVSVKRSCA